MNKVKEQRRRTGRQKNQWRSTHSQNLGFQPAIELI